MKKRFFKVAFIPPFAKGLGEVARRIEDIAAANNIPIEKNRDALQALSCLKVGQSINEDSLLS